MTPSPPVEPPAHEAAPPPLMSAEEVAELRGLIAQPVTPADLLRFDAVQIKGVIYVEETQLRAVVQKALALNAPFRLAAPSLLSTAERAIAMREALEPFALYGAVLAGQRTSGDRVLVGLWGHDVTVDDFRRAHFVFSDATPTPQAPANPRLAALEEENARLREATKRAADMLGAVAGDLEDGYSLGDIRGKYVMTLIDARDSARAALERKP